MPIDVTTDYIRIRVHDPGLFAPKTFRTVSLTKGIKSVMGKLLSPPEGKKGSMTVQTLLFSKNSYTKDEAVKWAKDHGFMGEAYSTEQEVVSEKQARIRYKTFLDDSYNTLKWLNLPEAPYEYISYWPTDGHLAGKLLKLKCEKQEESKYEILYDIVDVELVKYKTALATSEAVKPKNGLEDFEYLIHHVEKDSKGKETIHHCLLYDHLGNMYEQDHLVVDGKTYHVIVGLEKTQDICWSDQDAKDNGIKPKAMSSGMTFKQKAKEW